jgi:hypothetical protein
MYKTGFCACSFVELKFVGFDAFVHQAENGVQTFLYSSFIAFDNGGFKSINGGPDARFEPVVDDLPLETLEVPLFSGRESSSTLSLFCCRFLFFCHGNYPQLKRAL